MSDVINIKGVKKVELIHDKVIIKFDNIEQSLDTYKKIIFLLGFNDIEGVEEIH